MSACSAEKDVQGKNLLGLIQMVSADKGVCRGRWCEREGECQIVAAAQATIGSPCYLLRSPMHHCGLIGGILTTSASYTACSREFRPSVRKTVSLTNTMA